MVQGVSDKHAWGSTICELWGSKVFGLDDAQFALHMEVGCKSRNGVTKMFVATGPPTVNCDNSECMYVVSSSEGLRKDVVPKVSGDVHACHERTSLASCVVKRGFCQMIVLWSGLCSEFKLYVKFPSCTVCSCSQQKVLTTIV